MSRKHVNLAGALDKRGLPADDFRGLRQVCRVVPEMGPRRASGDGLFGPIPGGVDQRERVVRSLTEFLKCGSKSYANAEAGD
jgi:hypothetical protein